MKNSHQNQRIKPQWTESFDDFDAEDLVQWLLRVFVLASLVRALIVGAVVVPLICIVVFKLIPWFGLRALTESHELLFIPYTLIWLFIINDARKQMRMGKPQMGQELKSPSGSSDSSACPLAHN